MKKHQHGFTLIEVLVVLLIVAIVTVAAVMAFGDFGRGRSEKISVEQFSRMLFVAQSQAILTPMVMGLRFTPDGYQFYQWSGKKSATAWQPIKNSVLNQSHAFDGRFRMRIKTIAGYDPSDNQGANTPAILLLPSGYVTPFKLTLIGKVHRFLVTVVNNGKVTLNTLTASS